MGGTSSGSSGNAMPPHMNQYQNSNQSQQQTAQQQIQFQQNHQYPPLQHPSHQNTFNYHHMFNRMQGQQPQSIVKSEMSGSSDDPYRSVKSHPI